ISSSTYAISGASEWSFTLVSDEVGGEFADAPAPFPSLEAADGARHSRRTASDPQFGATRGEATDAAPSPLADADDTLRRSLLLAEFSASTISEGRATASEPIEWGALSQRRKLLTVDEAFGDAELLNREVE